MSTLRALFALAIFRWLLLAATILGCALLPLPLLGVHGVESAVALGAVLPPLCALLGARLALAARSATRISQPSELAQHAVSGALCLLAAPVIVLGVNAFFVRNCAPLEGLLFIALGPGCGVVLAALVGACSGSLFERSRVGSAVAVLVPLVDSVRACVGFYASPAVFAYGHFFGYFPGSLYDDLVELPVPLLTLRLLTALICSALLCLLVSHYHPFTGRLRLAPQPERRGARTLLVVSTLLALWGYAQGEELGHRSSVAYIAQTLGARQLSQRCELVLPREMRRQKRTRMAKDCDFRVRQLERWLDLKQRERVRVFVFRSADEKRRLMGAADTNIAKPWRNEIYLQDDASPHPVLPHEMAHVILGNAGRGPLHVAGKWFGLWPDFALIEGAAVAAAWASSSPSSMTPHQWTRAMLELKLLPKLEALFGTGFLNQQTRLAYTVSGSLLRYIAETHGTSALLKIYESGEIAGTLGISLAELERRFHAYLMSVELPPSARALAALRFAGSSILSDVCPHVKAKLRQQLDGELSADDQVEAAKTCQRLLAIDPAETLIRATLVGVLARRGQGAAAERELARLKGPPAAAAPVIASARQLLADEEWRNGHFEVAQPIYRELLQQPNERDALRMLQVKSLALEGSPRQRALIFALLVGEPGQSTDGATAVYLVRELRAERKDGLPQYLEARQLHAHERYAESVALLVEARRLGLPTPEISIEATRLEAMARYASGDSAGAQRLWLEQKTGAGAKDLGLRAEADDWLERLYDASMH